MASKSFIQTVEVVMPKSTNVFLTMKMAPPRINFEAGEVHAKVQYDEDLKMSVTWFPDGSIEIIYDTGVVEFYSPKPTLAYAVGRPAKGGYSRFHVDGSVETKYDNQYYYWGPEEDVEWNMNNIYTAYGDDFYEDDSYEERLWRYRDY